MQLCPSSRAERTPFQRGAGRGGRQRKAPTGGAAYGIPRKTVTPLVESTSPSSIPVSIATRGGDARCSEATDMSIIATAAIRAGEIIAISLGEVLWPAKLFVERPARHFG